MPSSTNIFLSDKSYYTVAVFNDDSIIRLYDKLSAQTT